MTQTTDRKLPHWLQDEFQSERLLPGLTSGLLIGITAVVIALSLGSLIFSGELASHFTDGIGIALATAAIILIAISLGSSTPCNWQLVRRGPSTALRTGVGAASA